MESNWIEDQSLLMSQAPVQGSNMHVSDACNAFISSENNAVEHNTTGETDVINDGRENDSTSNEEENDVHEASSSPEDEENNSYQSDENEDSNTSSDFNVEEVTEEQAVNLSLEGDDNSSQFRFLIRELEPSVGMEFETEDDAYNHYNDYAKEMGFSVRKYRVERSRVDNRILARSYVCANQGEKWCNDKRRRGMNYMPRASKKTNCGVVMRIKSRNGKWVVDLWEKEHNHPMVDLNDSFRLRSHQKANSGTIQLIEWLQKCGIRQSQIMTILKDFAGGEQHVGLTEDSCRNLIRSKRRKSIGIDCQQAINYLHSKQASEVGFFYAVRVNEEQQLIGIFWIDSRAREQYKKFGDVIVFDTTYKKNKYKFPFAPFTGVNHHMHCILFGCGLIADETKESFMWLFQTWLQAMHNIHPKAILTEEDPGIMRAIRHVFPYTVHRFCGWHLENHMINHIRPLYKRYPDLKAIYKSCINDSKIPSEFEERWASMIQRYNLEEHKWLRRQYKLRKHWVPCYYADTFFAGMSTIQRGESMNNYFKGFFTPFTPINEFVTQYEEAIKKIREKEAKADVDCITSTPSCRTTHKVEEQAANVYTTKVFKVFTEEWYPCFGLEVRQCDWEFPVKRYKVFLRDKDREINVTYVLDNQEAEITTCSCKMFEHKGLLCRHILKVYVITDRSQIPQHYILPRWSKSAVYDSSGSKHVEGSSDEQPQQPV
ncbi:protein FAR1-RELATED SEQUENCE 5-like [Telopea speciosissima]|uniref:protein FAR1-RELATED SEQUENCE 5-like n=1 Tax=Telopea speciosissima TaxID=54955 RepID=UPI001CC6096B|nr:protein FAR1-RELATED SEQUENCE 5-like [Telopea speciosissima]